MAAYTLTVTHNYLVEDGFVSTDTTTWAISPAPGGAGTQASPYQMAGGDTVTFKYVRQNSGGTLCLFTNFNNWTNNTASNLANNGQTTRTWATTNSAGDTDLVVANPNVGTSLANIYFTEPYVEPDLDITTDKEQYTADEDDSTIPVVVSNGTPGTTYRFYKDGTLEGFGRVLQNQTSVTINLDVSDTAIPSDEYGVAQTYKMYGVVTPAFDGDNINYYIKDILVTKGDPIAEVDPTKDSYGIAIYDNGGTFVTSFTEESFIPRIIYENTQALSSTAQVTHALTGLAGLSDSNTRVVIKGVNDNANALAAITVPARCESGAVNSAVRFAATPGAPTVTFQVVQTKGATVTTGSSDNYGFQIRNAENDIIIDQQGSSYGVKEIIKLSNGENDDSTLSNGSVTLVTTLDHVDLVVVNLVASRYLVNDGIPIPCISYEDGNLVLIQPMIAGTAGSGNSAYYTRCYCYITKGSDRAKWKLAMLTQNTSTATPSFYGGSEPDFGLQVDKADGTIAWHSGWRQPVGNNIISANQFTTGVTLSGAKQVGSGQTGVTAPPSTKTSLADTEATGSSREFTGLNTMDPANTYLMGGNVLSGYVEYYSGDYSDADSGDDYTNVGGGRFVPGISIVSSTSARIRMVKLADGSSGGTDFGLNPDSHKCAGQFILLRIT